MRRLSVNVKCQPSKSLIPGILKGNQRVRNDRQFEGNSCSFVNCPGNNTDIPLPFFSLTSPFSVSSSFASLSLGDPWSHTMEFLNRIETAWNELLFGGQKEHSIQTRHRIQRRDHEQNEEENIRWKWLKNRWKNILTIELERKVNNKIE